MATRGEQLTEQRVREIVREEIERSMKRMRLTGTVEQLMTIDGRPAIIEIIARLERAAIEERRTIPRPEDP